MDFAICLDPTAALETVEVYGIDRVRDTDDLSMTADEFRLLALSFPQVRYATNLGAINFLIGDKIFATLGGPDPGLATLKLAPEDQAKAVALAGSSFFPHPGGAGARGVTCVRLAHARADLVSPVLAKAVAKAGRRTTTSPAPTRR